MFVRLKRIKGMPYAYLVKNLWRQGKSQQKVVKYLGRAYNPPKLKELQTEVPEDFYQALRQLISKELQQHGFVEAGNTLVKDGITVDLDKKTVTAGKRQVVVQMNEGFLCEHTLKQAMAYERKHEQAEKEGPRLAEVLLATGLSLPQEEFVQMYERSGKLIKEGQVGEKE